jgi:uncharacterized protein with HEPN domain
MLDLAEAAASFVANRRRSDLDDDLQLEFAPIRALEVVGEAANRIPLSYQHAHAEVAWRQIIAMRNRLAHAYEEVDLDLLWAAATVELPALIEQLNALLGAET